MTEREFVDRLRYIFDVYFNDDEKMWDYVYNMCMTTYYRDHAWKLMKRKKWRKNVESDGSK